MDKRTFAGDMKARTGVRPRRRHTCGFESKTRQPLHKGNGDDNGRRIFQHVARHALIQ